jgi:hypothetical protein
MLTPLNFNLTMPSYAFLVCHKLKVSLDCIHSTLSCTYLDCHMTNVTRGRKFSLLSYMLLFFVCHLRVCHMFEVSSDFEHFALSSLIIILSVILIFFYVT